MDQNRKMEDEKARKDQDVLVQRTTDFWTGNIPVDPTLERFDSAPGRVSIIVKRDIWGDGEDEDPWLKVCDLFIRWLMITVPDYYADLDVPRRSFELQLSLMTTIFSAHSVIELLIYRR